jgi:hypothetical protein
MKVIEVDLPDKGRVVFVFEIFWENLLSELSHVFDRKGPFLLVVKYDVLIFFVLQLHKYRTFRISISFVMNPAILPVLYFFFVIL